MAKKKHNPKPILNDHSEKNKKKKNSEKKGL